MYLPEPMKGIPERLIFTSAVELLNDDFMHVEDLFERMLTCLNLKTFALFRIRRLNLYLHQDQVLNALFLVRLILICEAERNLKPDLPNAKPSIPTET